MHYADLFHVLVLTGIPALAALYFIIYFAVKSAITAAHEQIETGNRIVKEHTLNQKSNTDKIED
jgi:hypothetical protein